MIRAALLFLIPSLAFAVTPIDGLRLQSSANGDGYSFTNLSDVVLTNGMRLSDATGGGSLTQAVVQGQTSLLTATNSGRIVYLTVQGVVTSTPSLLALSNAVAASLQPSAAFTGDVAGVYTSLQLQAGAVVRSNIAASAVGGDEIEDASLGDDEFDDNALSQSRINGLTNALTSLQGYTSRVVAVEGYTSRVVGVEAYTSRVVAVEGYTSRVVAVEGYTNRAASALASSVWAAADSTTNYVPRTGGTMSGNLTVVGLVAETVSMTSGGEIDLNDGLLSNVGQIGGPSSGSFVIDLSAQSVIGANSPFLGWDSDKLDGQHGAYYRDWANITNAPNVATSGQWNASVAGASNLAFAVGVGATNFGLAIGAGATSLVASVSNALTLVDGAARTNSWNAQAALSNLALAAYGYASNNGAAAWSSSSATQTVNFGSQSGTNIAAFRFNTSTSGAPDRGTLRVTNGTTLAFTGASGVERPVAVLGENLNINQYQTTANAQNAATNYVRWMGSSAPTSGTANGNAWEVVPHTATSILFRVGTSNRWFVIPGYYMP